jgi:hypothetical protein
VADSNALPSSSSSGGSRTLFVVVGLVIAVVVAIIIVHAVQDHLHNSQELSVYDRCLSEPWPNGSDCQTIRHDCSTGDSHACHLNNVLECTANNTGLNPACSTNTGSTMAPPWRSEFALG